MYVMTAANINLLVSTEREEEPFNSNSNNSKSPLKIIKFTRYTLDVFGYTEKRKECLLT